MKLCSWGMPAVLAWLSLVLVCETKPLNHLNWLKISSHRMKRQASYPPAATTSATITPYPTTTNGTAFWTSSSTPNPDCSQNLTGTEGRFNSPGAGVLYSNNLDCTYTIPSPPAGNHIVITFHLFQLESHSSCLYDYVRFSYTSRKICGQKSTPLSYTFVSQGRDFQIHFHTDGSVQYSGFNATFSIRENSCKQVLTDAEGLIQVPGNGSTTYSPNLDCLFTIRPPAGGPWVVNITLEDFDVQRYYSSYSNYFSSSCNYDYLQFFYDGYSSSRMCGTRSLPISYIYNIFDSDLNITFHTDSSTERRGFNITYTYMNNSCVTNLNPNNGTIRSPVAEGGLTYPADTLCIYYLDLQDSLKTVTFTVRVFDVRCGDYFSINGQRFCGYRLTQTSFPLTGRINITFLSDSTGVGRGVDVDYHVTDYTCDKVYHSTSGSIDSYSLSRLALTDDMDCEYIIRPPYYPFVMTMYFSPFYMPFNSMNSSDTCSGSYVEINDRQYCGTVYGQYNFTIGGPELPVRYHHSATADPGRNEVYHIYYHTRPVSCNVTLTNNAGYINSDSGYASTSVYSRSYNNNTYCTFTIKADNAVGQTIHFSLNRFQLEDRDNSTSLCKDYVDMNDEVRLCGYQYGNRSFTFNGTFVVTFISDNSQTNLGFSIYYNIVPDGCIVSHSSTEGTLHSPVASNGLYHNNLHCRYTLSSPYTMAKITVTVNRFDLEPSSYSFSNCYNDYLYYTDGSYTSGRYCGLVAAGTTFIWYTSARQLDVFFLTNNEISRPGFNVSYKIEEDRCDQIFSDPSGRIRSPVYSTGLYRSNLNCTYIIRPPTQGPYRFNLTYSQFDVQRTYYNSSYYSVSTSCSYDYVEIRFSGLTSTSRLCGRMSSPRTYFYNPFGGDLAIRFVTDRSIQRRGFVLDYSFEENSCMQILTDAEGLIQVPGNGSTTYSPNLDCLFTIRPPAGGPWVVNITLEDFDVQRYYSSNSNYFSNACSYDYLQFFYDGYTSSRMCGTRSLPISYIYNIFDSDLNITFHTDSSTERRGFNITYTYMNNSCVTNLNPNNGTVRSPVAEGGLTYPADTLCIYYLDLQDSLKTVTFTVRVFDVRCGDYFSINGQRFCGYRLTQTSFHLTGRINITFLSDSTGVGRGVDVDYHVTDYTCDKVYHSTSGSIDSYSVSRLALTDDMDCEYIIRPPYYPFVITMYFSPFYMPFNFINSSDTCSGSYVEINDRQYCGTVYGQYNFTIGGPELPVRYHHSATADPGRNEVYHIYYHTRPVSCNVTLTNNAGYINSDSGYASTSVYSRSYNNNTHCTFTIKGDDAVGQTIHFSLNRFQLEDRDNSTSLCKDYVDMNDEVRLCGYQYGNRSFTFNGTFVVTFISDNSQTNLGFSIYYNIVPDGCIVSSPSTEGTLHSPMASNGLYHNNLHCRYTLSSPYTMAKITVTVNRFDLEPSSYSFSNCYNDYLYYTDGSYTSGRYCGLVAAGTTFIWYTSARQLDVFFLTNNAISRPGFNVSYKIEEDRCDQMFSDPSGRIRSPVYSTGLYRSNLNCTYIIRPPTQGPYRFNLTYSQFDVQRTYYNSSYYSVSTSCSYDYVEIRFSGLTSPSRLCGRMSSPRTYFYNPFGGDLAIRFVTDRSIQRRGFVLDYSFEENSCMQILTDAEGLIQVPGNGSTTYSPNLDCLFTIRPPAGGPWVVNITLEDFDVQRYYSSNSNYFSNACSYDYLQLFHDGYSSRMCGTRSLPISYIYNIFDSDLNITFHTDSSTERRGFNITYTYMNNSCVTNLNPNNGTIRSPVAEGGLTYPADTLCIYYLDLQDSLKTVTFTVRVFDVRCGDYFSINGQRFCGYRLTQTSFHLTGRINITFLSDSTGVGRGVDVDYHVTDYTCDKVYHSTSGSIDSYSVSRLALTDDMDCEYIIRPPYYPFVITMYFSPFYMPFNFINSSDTCSGSYVEINDRQYCGTVYGQYNFTIGGPELPVRYHHSATADPGRNEVYHIYYHTRPVSCNVTLTNNAGYINSDSGYASTSVYSRSYNNNTHCTFTIKGDDAVGQTIHFSLNRFQLEDRDNSTSLCKDYVDMNDEVRLCGYQYGNRSFTFNGTFVVTFISDNSQTNLGFSIYYNIVPDGCIVSSPSTEGTLHSPMASNGLYHNNLHCRYTLSSPYTMAKITVTVNRFDLEPSSYSFSNCYNDYLYYTDGSYTSGRYCGLVAAGTTFIWYTSARQLDVFFLTNNAISRPGFNVSYKIEEDRCDQMFSDPSGRIRSPVYSTGLYRSNLNCTYIIRPPTQGPYRFNLTYSQFDVQRTYYNSSYYSVSTSCSYDYVEIRFSGLTSPSRLCGRMSSPRTYFYNPFGGDLAIRFVTDRSIQRRGFVLDYSFEENSCMQILTDAEGLIQVPGNGSTTYSPNLDCLFTIRPPAGGPWVVNITLEDFDVQRYYSSNSNYFSNACSYDYLQLFHDGYSSRMCGTRSLPISYIYNIFDSDLNITFHTDSSTERRGFNITYTYMNNSCVTNLNPNNGTIRSPVAEGGLTYPADTLCIYYLDLQDSLKTVTFTVRVFDVRCGDYFSINGQRFCGYRLTQTSFHLTGRINITFLSDSTGVGRGVDVDYHVTDYTCDKVYHSTSGSIDSYSVSRLALTDDMDCEYIIRPPYYPFVITMYFSPFYMPFNFINSSDTCSGSYVEINDRQYCGTVYGQYNFTIGGPELPVRYHHSATADPGRNEVYHIYYHTRPVSCNVTLTNNAGYINSDSGYASTSVYSRSYNNNTHCTFTIKGDDAVGQTIHFRLNRFRLEDRDNSTSLCKDYVDMNDEVRLCGYQYGNRSFTFNGTFVVTFISDNSQTNLGFSIYYNIVPDGCIVSHSSTEGTLHSPVASNGLYHNNLHCRYTLSSPYTMAKITVTVNRFDLEPSSYSFSNCYNDYLYYTDGSYTSGRYCGLVAAGTTFIWYTSAGEFEVFFLTNNEISRPGFNVSYKIEEDRCDQMFSDPSGRIRSPLYSTGLYRSNLNCTYIIRPPTQGPYRFNLTYSQFDIQRTYYNSSYYSVSTSCSYDYVEIRFSGLTSPSRLCGRMSSPRTYFYNPFGGDLAIRFVTDRSIQRRGFVLDYSFEENSCVQILTDAEGLIQVPGNGSTTYSPNLDCLFTIRPPAGRAWIVNITLEEFDVQRYYSYLSNYFSSSCNYDYLQFFYDGYSSSRMCGTRSSPISYMHNIVDGDLNITFHSDSSTQRSGFQIRYSYTENVCDYVFRDNQGVIESPNDGNYHYHNNMLCRYTFVGGNDLYNIFYNVSYFDIYYTSGCSSDYLEFPDGRRYCGTYLSNTSYAAVGNTSLTFRSDASYSRRGFRIQYKAIPFDCSRGYTEERGIITDPNLSGVGYNGNVSCTYTFLMPFYPFIVTFSPIQFALLDPGTDGVCTSEYVSQDRDRFCGQRNASWQGRASNNTMEVNYFSTGAVRGNYSVFYHVTPDVCNTTYTSLSGRVSGNMSSDNSGSTCYYRIQNIMPSSQIHIRLTSQSRSASDSECNSVDFDGLERRCVGIGTYGTENTYPFDGDFTITLRRTAGAEPPSFNLYYNILPENCTQRFTTDTGSIASPADADGNYLNDLTCTYTISGGSSPYILSLNFITLDLQSSSYCNSDYVRFRYRGSSGYITTTSRYCTGPRSLRYTVSGGDFNISFVTDGREVRRGFNAIYAKMPVSCNRTYTADEGIIESTPGNGSSYPNNAYCTYTIQGNSTQETVEFTVQTFSLESHSSCFYDSLQLGSTSSRKYCGSSLAGRVLTYTFTNTFTLYFKTDGSVTRRGFLISYRRLPYVPTTTTTTTTTTTPPIPNCNTTFTAASGQLRSPKSPLSYPNNIYCRYTFVGSGQTQFISLDFTSFAVENHASCRWDWVIVNGGNKRCGFTEFTRAYTFVGNFTVEFRTDSSVTYSGFVANYVVSDAANTTTPAPSSTATCTATLSSSTGTIMSPPGGGTANTTTPAPSSTATCTATLSSSTGTIMSPPGGGSNYLDNTRCYYTFTATSYPRTITFTFSTFQLESHSTCRYDFVQFNNGIKKCGTISNLVYTDTMYSQYRVTFYTDGSVTRRGFVATYQISNVTNATSTIPPSTVASNNGRCGTTLTSSTGRIYYPATSTYDNNVRCQVTIRPGAGQTFNVTFTEFDIENQSSCNFDSLVFRVNGVDSAKYCGRNRAGLALSFPYTSGDIVVTFRTDGSVTGRGFDLNFQVA